MAWPVTGSDSWLTHHKVEVTGSLVLTAPHFSPQPSQAEFCPHRAALGSSQTSAASHPTLSHPTVSHPTLPLCGQLGVYPPCLAPFLPLMSVTLILARSPPLPFFSLPAVLGVPSSRKPSWAPGRLPLPSQNSIPARFLLLAMWENRPGWGATWHKKLTLAQGPRSPLPLF